MFLIPVSGGPNVADYYFSAERDGGRRIYISPLPDHVLADSESDFGVNRGHFLYEKGDRANPDEVVIIAHLLSKEAVFSLVQLLNME
jgi:hypothetical protein